VSKKENFHMPELAPTKEILNAFKKDKGDDDG
jgi:hypothetical protein